MNHLKGIDMFIIRSLGTKEVEEKIFFHNSDDGRDITIVIAWRNGEVYTDEYPELDNYVEAEGSPVPCDQGEELMDNWHSRVEGDVNEDEADEILEAWNEELESGVEELGWGWCDREIWFYGPIEVIEDEEE